MTDKENCSDIVFTKLKAITSDEMKDLVKQHTSLSLIPKRKQFKHLDEEDFFKLKKLVKKDHQLFWDKYKKQAFKEIGISLADPRADLLWNTAMLYTKNWKSLLTFHSNLQILSMLIK